MRNQLRGPPPCKGKPNPAPETEGAVRVVRDWMASAVAQVVVVIPASEIPYVRGRPDQHQGIWPRIPMREKDREEVCLIACTARAVNGISKKAVVI